MQRPRVRVHAVTSPMLTPCILHLQPSTGPLAIAQIHAGEWGGRTGRQCISSSEAAFSSN